MSSGYKSYFCKVYNVYGQFIDTWNEVRFDSFSQTINGGLGQIRIELPRKFDDFGEGRDVKFANEVRLYVVDSESGPEGKSIYSGYISRYEPYIDGTNEGITVTCLGYITHLKRYPLTGEATPSYSTTGDISEIMSYIIGAYNSYTEYHPSFDIPVGFHRINTSDESIPENTGDSVTYTFPAYISMFDALEKMRKYAPANWWWFIGADNLLQFKRKPKGSTHKFIFGKDFRSVKVTKNIESMVNHYQFWNGQMLSDEDYILENYYDRPSQQEHYDWFDKGIDGRVSIDATADLIGNSQLAEFKDPEIEVEIEIVDSNGGTSGYDIESIQVGDTCSLKGFNDITSKTFEDNMTISELTYTPDSVRIVLWNKSTEVGRQFEKINSQLDDTINGDAGN